jgi:hypothetical protein
VTPAHHELPLFDAARTVDSVCEDCGAVREAGQDKSPDCEVDRDRAEGNFRSKRPRACLNQFDPTADPFPDGY